MQKIGNPRLLNLDLGLNLLGRIEYSRNLNLKLGLYQEIFPLVRGLGCYTAVMEVSLSNAILVQVEVIMDKTDLDDKSRTCEWSCL